MPYALALHAPGPGAHVVAQECAEDGTAKGRGIRANGPSPFDGPLHEEARRQFCGGLEWANEHQPAPCTVLPKVAAASAFAYRRDGVTSGVERAGASERRGLA